MNRPFYAINARDLLETRRDGRMPAKPVSVVLDRSPVEQPALYLRDDMPLERMDWRMLVNLEVVLWADASMPFERVQQVARSIAAVIPRRMVLLFTDPDGTQHQVDLGIGMHRPAIDEFPAWHEFLWYPINASLTSLGERLRRGFQ